MLEQLFVAMFWGHSQQDSGLTPDSLSPTGARGHCLQDCGQVK